jgi:hypothetical protein
VQFSSIFPHTVPISILSSSSLPSLKPSSASSPLILLRVPPTPSRAYARLSLLALTKSLVLNVLPVSLTQDLVNLNENALSDDDSRQHNKANFTGSPPITKTIGIVVVAASAARAGSSPPVVAIHSSRENGGAEHKGNYKGMGPSRRGRCRPGVGRFLRSTHSPPAAPHRRFAPPSLVVLGSVETRGALAWVT